MIKIEVGIEGMGCEVCENRIKDAISKNFAVKKVTASHKNKNAEIIAEEEIDKDAITGVIEKEGFQVTSYTSGPYKKFGLFG